VVHSGDGPWRGRRQALALGLRGGATGGWSAAGAVCTLPVVLWRTICSAGRLEAVQAWLSTGLFPDLCCEGGVAVCLAADEADAWMAVPGHGKRGCRSGQSWCARNGSRGSGPGTWVTRMSKWPPMVDLVVRIRPGGCAAGFFAA
jgi:hypothetical protein